MKSKTWQGMAAAGLLLAGGASQAALVDAGNGLVNDTVLDITWVANAGLSNDELGGSKTWQELVDWAENLVYAGYDDWRLASMSTSAATDSVHNCSSGTEDACIASGNELGYMFNFNITGDFPKAGDKTVGDVELTGIQNAYWSGTEYAPSPGYAWVFNANFGFQYNVSKVSQYYGWAVRPGQVAAAPLPGTALLMALGFGALSLSRRARRRLW
jgi:hypothetical protein